MDTGVILALFAFFTGLAVGIPIGWVFLGCTLMGLFFLGDSINFMSTTFFHSLNSQILMAVGFFIFAGGLLAEAGLAKRIVSFSQAIVGKTKGGLIVVAIVATLFMGALTGSSLPCISALIPLLVPELEKYGYEKRYTTAVLCSSSFLGYLIPPSVPALIYCLIAQQSVAALFLSTVFPGLLLAMGYIILNRCIVDKYRIEPQEGYEIEDSQSFSIANFLRTTRSALPALGCPVVILVGIYGGIFTPSEAGAVAVVYTVLIGAFVYKDLTRKRFDKALTGTILTLGMSTILLAGGAVMTRFFIRYGVAQSFAAMMLSLFHDKYLILLSLNLFLLILGMFIDGIPIMIMAIPLILPIAKELDINLIHLGAMVIVNIGIGVMTPPFAISIFVGSKLSGVPSGQLVGPMMKYLFFVAIPVLMLTTYVPFLSCWLPTVVLGPSMIGQW